MWLKLIFSSLFIVTVSAKAVHELDFDFDSALCENRLSAFTVTDNGDVSGSPSREIANVTEAECMEICGSNRDADGRLVICASFTYDHVIFKCSIYKRKAGPDGDLEKIAAPGKKYFEKFCLDEDSPKQCADAQFVRIDDSILSGYAKNTSIHSTMAGCINQCLKEEFVCKSAMYFYEEGECITNVESGQNVPEDFGTPDDGDKVVYFSNGCISSESSKNETDTDVSVETEKETEKTDKKEKSDEKEKTEESKTDTEVEKILASKENDTSSEVTTSAPSEVTENAEESKEEKAKIDANKLYGAKQLTQADNGTITVDDEVLEKNTDKSKEAEKESKDAEDGKKSAEGTEVSPTEKNDKITDEKVEDKEEKSDTEQDQTAAPNTEETVAETKAPETEELKPVFKIDENPEFTEKAAETEPEEPQNEDPLKYKVLKTNPLKLASTKSLQIQKLASTAEQPKEEDSYFSKWSDWTECTQPGQRKIRRRKCLDLRKCKGALMQVDWCPKVLPKAEESLEETSEVETGPIGPTRNPLPVAMHSSEGNPPGILPPQLPQKELKPLPEGAPGHPDDVWSPWLGVCQQFASNQPCKNNEVIGFESRECIAKDPQACKGPFFRYCTLPC